MIFDKIVIHPRVHEAKITTKYSGKLETEMGIHLSTRKYSAFPLHCSSHGFHQGKFCENLTYLLLLLVRMMSLSILVRMKQKAPVNRVINMLE
uniref:Glucan endo-1 3-beta-glucosidase 7 n=1 Tax=Rhizophora mucronata TaxID=61149 RepID=A0A2P2P918_RHIMU